MRIRSKLMLLSLLFAGVPFVAAACYSFLSFETFSKAALQAGISLGESVLDDNTKAMEEQARQSLAVAASARAATLAAEIRGVEAALEGLGTAYELACDGGGQATVVPEYLCADRPTTSGRHARFFLPHGVMDADGMAYAGMLRVGRALDGMIQGRNQVEAAGIVSPEGACMMAPWDDLPDEFDPRVRQWHIDARKHAGTAVWGVPYISASSRKLVVTCSRTVSGFIKTNLDSAATTPAGVLFADVDLFKMTAAILATDGDSASAILLDRDGNIIAQNGMMTDVAWNEKVALESVVTTGTDLEKALVRRMMIGEAGVVRGAYFGERDAFVAFAPVAGPKWSIAILMSVSDVLASVDVASTTIASKTAEFAKGGKLYTQSFLWWFVALGGLGVCVLLLACLVVSRRVTRPIDILAAGAHTIGSGDFDHRITVATGDELEELGATFNAMAGSLKTYMENLAQTVAAKERIEQELAVAAEIQLSMLPREFPPFPERTDIDMHASMTPAREVGGDFYDYFFVDEEHLWFCIGDVCGKGVPAALFMAITKTLLAGGASTLRSPAAILLATNNILARNNENCMFATVFCGFLNVRTGKVCFANAGHNPPILRVDNVAQYLTPKHVGVPVGPMEQREGVFVDEEVMLPIDGALVLYTDGVTEAFNPEAELLGEDRLLVMAGDMPRDARGSVDGIAAGVSAFVREADQSDDITMVVLRRSE